MPFDWSLYLDLAKRLSAENSEEAMRSGISRAYYSVYCTARNHLHESGIPAPATGEAHKWVWTRFSNGRADCRRLGTFGLRLQRRRQKADYEDDVMDLRKETDAALADADEFFFCLSNLKGRCG
jgi:uncharacterized protein (UPF0332 family)